MTERRFSRPRPFIIEVTDTVNGRAAFNWVIRGTTGRCRRQNRVRAVKQLAGWEGIHCYAQDVGEVTEVRPSQASGILQVAFVRPAIEPIDPGIRALAHQAGAVPSPAGLLFTWKQLETFVALVKS